MNKRRRTAGTSLIEVLTVIVVFLVGILAIIQIFPNGFRIVRDTKNSTTAAALAAAEGARVSSRASSLPDMIAPVVLGGPTGYTALNVQHDPDELGVPSGVAQIDSNGNLVIGGASSPVNWGRGTGANVVSRVIGEGGPVPAPRQVGAQFGGLIQLTFSPMVYDIDPTTKLGKPGQVVVYGNDLQAKQGDQSNLDDLVPLPTDASASESAFYFVPASKAQNSPVFANEDQVMIGAPIDASTGNPYASTYRVRYSYVMSQGGGTRTHDGIFVVDSTNAAYALPSGTNYTVISLKQLVASSGLYGGGGGTPADYRGVVPGSIQIERVFEEILPTDGWNSTNPYQYKVQSMGLGAILVNQYGSGVRVQDAAGNSTPLIAKVDYSVYDWRIIRDEIRVPSTTGGSVKLSINSIKSQGTRNADNTTYRGINGGAVADYSLLTPDSRGVVASQDLVVQDVETGGVILGNDTADSKSAWYADKSRGVIVFRTVDGTKSGLQAYVAYPTGTRTITSGALDTSTLWSSAGATVDISNRPVRVLYRANGEFAAQVMKAASVYQVSYPSDAASLGAGQCYVGGSAGWGSGNRLYFPLADFGQKVVVGDAMTTSGDIHDQDLLINGKDGAVAYATLPGSGVFDYSKTGYAVRWVRGTSLKVRVLWNPDTFALTNDAAQNYENFTRWSQSWRKLNTETVEIGGQLK